MRLIAVPALTQRASLGTAYAEQSEEVEMLERLIDVEVTRHGTIIEELEIVCCMTGFRLRLLVEHLGEGLYRSVELGPG